MNEKEQATKVAEETKTNEVVNEVANASTVQGRDAVIKALKTNPNNFVELVLQKLNTVSIELAFTSSAIGLICIF